MEDTYEDLNRVLHIPVNAIKPNPYQPRKYFDVTSVSELAKSISEYGLIQPITVRRLGAGDYELVAGERRLRAAQLAQLETIPSLIVDITDNDSAILALVENLQRKDLNFFEEAEAYFHLVKDHGITQEQLSKKIGKKQSTIANKLRLLKLSPQLKKLILENDLTERHARALLRLPDDEMRIKIVKNIIEKSFNVSASEKYIDDEIRKILSKKQKESLRRHMAVNDYRIFLNTIKKAVEMVKNAGGRAKAKQIEYDDYYEYVIRINK